VDKWTSGQVDCWTSLVPVANGAGTARHGTDGTVAVDSMEGINAMEGSEYCLW